MQREIFPYIKGLGAFEHMQYPEHHFESFKMFCKL